VLGAALILSAISGFGQDLAPRAYIITPVDSSAMVLAYSFNSGSVFVDPSVPVEDFSARFHTQILSYYRSFDLAGRSANITAVVPYAIGNFSATVAGSQASVYRSGLADSRVRLAVNLWGGPAMHTREFVGWKETRLLGASLTVLMPTGQYDPARLINPGNHRWGFKPEMAISRRWQHWVLEGYAGAWFFTPNNEYLPGTNRRTQEPIIAGEAHLTYYVKPRLWFSLDGNFWSGAQSTVNGVQSADKQRNSRTGVTAAIPLNQHQSLKFSYSNGTYVTIGGDYQSVSAAWQYSWVGKLL
jgi:hypothetical protein